MNAELERLEIKVAFLERANQELSDVVFRQQQEIDELRIKLVAVGERLDAVKAADAPYSVEQERPPHY